MSLTIRTVAALAAVSAIALTAMPPSAARAHAAMAGAMQCLFYSGPDGDALYANHGREAAGVMSFVRAGGGMSCKSARYVARALIRQWNRRGHFARTWFDGYVTWHGRVIGRRSWGAQIIRYREFTSRTSLTFDWQVTVF